MARKFNNPYVFGTPVQNSADFFGREYELQIMLTTIAHLAPGYRQSMAVVAPRRVGKSSLLLELKRQLQSLPNITIFMSTASIVEPSPLLLTQEILRELHDAAQSKGIDASDLHFELIEGSEPSSERVFQVFRNDLRRFNNMLESKQLPPVVLMIDEVEGLQDFGGPRVFGLFRDLSQSLSYILFVVAGSDLLFKLITENTSPFFNVFKTIYLKSLEEEAARIMIRAPAEREQIRFDNLALNDVLRLSGGFPFLIKLICHYATETALMKNSDVITQNNVALAVDRIFSVERAYFLDVWNRTVGLEKILIYYFAVTNVPHLFTDIVRVVANMIDFSQPLSQIYDSLEHLKQHQIIYEDKGARYSFTNQLLPMWILKNYTAQQVAEESSSISFPNTNGETKQSEAISSHQALMSQIRNNISNKLIELENVAQEEKIRDEIPFILKGILTRDIMTTEVYTISRNASVEDAAHLLTIHHISGLPVLDDSNNLIGLVSEYDIMIRSGKKVSDIMSPGVISVSSESNVEEVVQKLVKNRIKRVLVIERDKLVGIVSRSDLVRRIAMNWICTTCGQVARGMKPPDCCDVCGAKNFKPDEDQPPGA